MINQQSFIEDIWNQSIIPTLMDYIRIPNKSPLFDANWQKNGYMDQAINLIANWCHSHSLPGMKIDIVRLEGRTPILFIDIPGQSDETILLYGHLDKQPEMSGWRTGLSPWQPVLQEQKLYGRGGADDGYSTFASLLAIKALQARQVPHARCIILIESCEESGSYDLPFYIDALGTQIGSPSLIICLDSGCANYDQLWVTTSLRGVITGTLDINVLTAGIHSGQGSGVVPSCMMILRQLLNRIENESSGKILLEELFVDIPSDRLQQAQQMADALKQEVYASYPFQKNVRALTEDTFEQILNRTWRPALSITGCDGLPSTDNAGNVTIPSLKIKLSIRIPPTLNPMHAADSLKKTLESDPPFNAKIIFNANVQSPGWNAPTSISWLTDALNQASNQYFGQNAMYMGEGGSIPFMGMLGEKFPQAQFVITGVLGPESNAHGPNEFLHIPTAKKLTCCIADIIASHYQN